MSKFYVGQKVLVTGPANCGVLSSDHNRPGAISTIMAYDPDDRKSEYQLSTGVWFPATSLQPITETTETLTINGIEYIRKPEPVVEHEWKFGDVATHEKYGVGIVTCIDGGELEFDYKNGDYSTRLSTSSLTFIRRADLSV